MVDRVERAAMFLVPPVSLTPGVVISFYYKNYHDEISRRRVRIIDVIWGATEWHSAPQALLLAHDLDKDAERAFALHDMRDVSTI